MNHNENATVLFGHIIALFTFAYFKFAFKMNITPNITLNAHVKSIYDSFLTEYVSNQKSIIVM